jgi:hypothetical protein
MKFPNDNSCGRMVELVIILGVLNWVAVSDEASVVSGFCTPHDGEMCWILEDIF